MNFIKFHLFNYQNIFNYYRIQRYLIPLNHHHFAKLGGNKIKVIFILETFTTF